MTDIESNKRPASMPNQNPGCLAAFLAFFHRGTALADRAAEPMPYHVRDDFLSDAEASFLLVLRGMMGERFLVFPKVGLSDVFFVSRPDQNAGARNRIASKHLDLLICDSGSLDPMFGIELDDSSHQNSNRLARDAFVDEVFDTAGLPLVRVPVKRDYDTRELGILFRDAMSQTKGHQAPGSDSARHIQHAVADPGSVTSAPLCPKCGIPMVVRRAARGPRADEQFYGCTNYPRCKSMLPYDQHEVAPV